MFKKLLQSKNYLDIYIVARWCYKCGIFIFEDDNIFDKYEMLLKKSYPELDYFNRSYSDDPEPTELLEKYDINLGGLSPTVTTRIKNYADILTDNKGISVRPVRSYEEAYAWYNNNSGKEIMHSVKINGIHTKNLVDVATGKILVSSSKASGTENFIDYTDGVTQKYFRLKTNRYKNIKSFKQEIIPVLCEAYVDTEGRRILEEEHDIVYKNARTAATGVLRRNLVDLIPDNIHIVAFSNLDNQRQMHVGIDNAALMGFEVVPYTTSVYNTMPFEEFKTWIDTIMSELTDYADSEDIPYDGIVAQIDCTEDYYKNYTNMYNDSNIALKLGNTAAEEIEAEVEAIRLVQGSTSSVQLTAKIFLKPAYTSDNVEITEISGYTLDNIISKGIRKGSKVTVVYQSGCYPTLK